MPTDEIGTMGRLGHRALFLAAVALIVFVRILPIDFGGGRMPAPDPLICLIFVWVLRRPGDLPVVLVAAVALFADVIFVRPLGLWALMTVAGAEVLRRRHHLTSGQPFVAEWARVAAVIAAMTLARVAILGVTLVPHPPLGAVVAEAAATILAYPVVALACVWGLGVRARSGSHEVRP